MDNIKPFVSIVVIATSVLAFASVPVAVRVDVEPLGVSDGGTRVAVTVQISPEDRGRVGKNAMLRIELDGDVPPGQSPLWAVRIENDGSGRIETVWPAGEHDLRVEVSNPSGSETGLWVGTVRIPGESSSAGEPETISPPPEPVPVPKPETVAAEEAVASAAAGVVAATPPESTAPSVPRATENDPSEEPPAVAESPAIAEAEAPPAEEPARVAAPPDDDPTTEIVEIEEPDIGIEAAAAAAGAAAVAGRGDDVPEVEREGEPEAPAAAEDVAPETEEATASEPETAVVEPLRSDPPVSTSDTGSEPPAPMESSVAAPTTPPAEVAAALAAWEDRDPDIMDLTVIVMRDRAPVSGLTTADFSLRVGGSETEIVAVGDAGRAPLQLGVAVDVAAESASGWSRAGGRLFALVQRTRAGRGHAFFSTDGRVGEWDREPSEFGQAARGTPTFGLTGLIADSLAQFAGRAGRSFLLVVTDGRSDSDKAGWKAASDAAANSGVPVLVIALWDKDFSHRIRKNLKTIADVSGGGLFLVQGSDQLDRAADRFGPMIDAGVALRFVKPPGVAFPASVAVETGDRGLDISAPKGVR